MSAEKEGCPFCKEKCLPFDTLTSLTYYDGVIKTVIHKFKYSKQKFLLSVLNDIIITNEKFKEIVPLIDVIVPVPLHWLKKLHRGFNQSELLSMEIQKRFLKPMSKNNLCRIKNTESQTHLTKSQRRVNIRNAFFVKDPKSFKGKKILLVDDVLTTGVTASECSKKLKKAGAESVHLLILAIADYHNYW
jgi:ComF family protein